jgi:hypothetical protein
MYSYSRSVYAFKTPIFGIVKTIKHQLTSVFPASSCQCLDADIIFNTFEDRVPATLQHHLAS